MILDRISFGGGTVAGVSPIFGFVGETVNIILCLIIDDELRF